MRKIKFQIQPYLVSPEEHQARNEARLVAARCFKASLADKDLAKTIAKTEAIIELPDEIPMARNPKWANKPFGAVNTVEKSGCIALTSRVICDFLELGSRGYDVSVQHIVDEIVNNGYRSWRFENFTKTLVLPRVTLKGIKEAFPEEERIQRVQNMRELLEVTGRPVGIGGSPFLVDNLVERFSTRPIRKYQDTRIYSVQQMLYNLKQGIIVPVRVNNSVYHNDVERKEGHYVTVFGIHNGNAIIIDSSASDTAGVKVIPFQRLLMAMVEDESLICAWDLSPTVE